MVYPIDLNRMHKMTGKGVQIAILDSGVNPHFPEIAGRSMHSYLCTLADTGLQVKRLDGDFNSDTSGHGSCVQSCLFNVAPEAEVHHYRILDHANNCSSELLCLALDHVIDKGYPVINLSLGTRNEALIGWLVSIMKRAYEANVGIVAASSNIGNSLFPSRFTYCISVSGADGLKRDQIRFQPGNVIEFAACGVRVPVRAPGKQMIEVTGSSYASAHVTGICARFIQAAHGKADPLGLKMALREYALQAQT